MLLDRLPRTSHLRAALSSDVELYRATVAGRPRAKPPAPPLTEHGPSEELLAALYDRLGEVVIGLSRLGGSKKSARLKPWPRPETAADLDQRARFHANRAHLEQAVTYVPMADMPAPTGPTAVRTRR